METPENGGIALCTWQSSSLMENVGFMNVARKWPRTSTAAPGGPLATDTTWPWSSCWEPNVQLQEERYLKLRMIRDREISLGRQNIMKMIAIKQPAISSSLHLF